MNICDYCGKDFLFASKLLRHLNKKNPCPSNKGIHKNDKEIYKNDKVDNKNDKETYKNYKDLNEKCEKKVKNIETFKCTKCSKILKSKQGLNYHMTICKGVNSLTCPTCLKVFSCCPAKNEHMRNVKCKPPEKDTQDDDIITLRKKVAILESKSYSSAPTITINNNITYIIKYNPETRCLTTDDPNAPFPELLCFNGFKYEAAKSKLKDIDKVSLQEHIDNVRYKKDYYALYSFFFRNVDNRRLHMFNLGKNNNATHAQVFNNGAIEKMEKSQLFNNVSKYIGQYLLNMSIDNTDVIHMLITEQASKTAFIEVTKDKSRTFNYYRDLERKSDITEDCDISSRNEGQR